MNIASTYSTSSDNYKLDTVIASSNSMNSTNYIIEIGTIPSGTMNSTNYKLKIGFYSLVRTDKTSPNLTLISPENNTYLKESDVPLTTFKYNVSDNIIVRNCSLYLQDVEKDKNTTIKQTNNHFKGYYLDFGTNLEWKITCYDDSRNSVTAFHKYTLEKETTTGGAISTPEPAGGGADIIPSTMPVERSNLTLKYICNKIGNFIEEKTLQYTITDLQKLQANIFNETGEFISTVMIVDYINSFNIFCGERRNVSTPYYDVTIRVLKDKYNLGGNAKAEITITNKGDIPDTDTALVYYLTNPIGARINENREQIKEVNIGETVFEKELLIPSNELEGEWRFNVEYFTTKQPPVFVFAPFQVKKGILPFSIAMPKGKATIFFLPIILIMVIIIYFNSTKKKRFESLKMVIQMKDFFQKQGKKIKSS